MSPEIAVAAEWRKVFTNAYVKLKLTLIAVDEAHCITCSSYYTTAWKYLKALTNESRNYKKRSLDFGLRQSQSQATH